MDMTEVRRLEEQKVGKIKLSDAIRECGYSKIDNYSDCVIGRAYKRLTGRGLPEDGMNYQVPLGREKQWALFLHCAADAFGVPFKVVSEAEYKCFDHQTHDQIADYVQAQGY